MGTKRINGFQLEKMLRNGLGSLQSREEELNRLNVFPVADGDTGTNMCLTLANGLKMAQSRAEVGAFLKTLSDGMLLGARGNSGVILSQFFRGVFQELSRCGAINPGELRNALIRGYRAAYESVVQPVEGTILTVAREGIEHIRSQIGRATTFEMLLSMYVAEMKKSLAFTPELLPALKEAGVVDSGAMGFIAIMEGMLKYFYGEVQEPQPVSAPVQAASPDFSAFNESSAFVDGYCMEFILQRMTDPKYNQHFRAASFIEDLARWGSSLVVVQDGKRVKVHVHTLHPAKIIALSQEFGEFLTFKLENMQLQHNEQSLIAAAPRHKALAVVAVAAGPGVADIYRDLGCDVTVDGGATMNTSAQEFLDAFSQVDAEAIVVLPNHPNILLAAEQAKALSGRENITVLPTRSCAQGYFALAMDFSDSSDVAFRVAQMRKGMENVVTLTQTTASRDYTYHEISCRKGEEIALLDNALACVADRPVQSILGALALVPDMAERETLVVFRGSAAEESEEEALAEALSARYPLLEVEFVDGGQPVYRWLMGLS